LNVSLLIDGIVYSLQKHGGISVYFNELLSRMVKNEQRFELSLYSNKSVALKELHCKFPVTHRMRLFERYRDQVVTQPDATVFHSSYYRLPQSKQLSVITTVHDFTYEKYFPSHKRVIHSWQKGRAIRASDAILCVSENTKKDLLTLYPQINENKVHVIYNGVNECFSSIGTCFEDFALFIGSRASYKGFYQAVCAIEKVKFLQLKIVGGGRLTSQEIKLLEDKIPGRYHYNGFVTNDELNNIYNTAFCLLYPSLYEGFGIPPLEAMRTGCPVIALNISSIPEVIPYHDFLCESNEVDVLIDRIESLRDVTGLRETLAQQGERHADKFSWDTMYRQTANIYNSFGV